MKLVLSILLMIFVVAAFAKNTAPKEKAQTVHKMNELKLQGKLKKPEIEFQAELNTAQEELVLAMPTNFDEEVKENGKEFLTGNP